MEPRGTVVRIYEENTIHCYTKNESSGLLVSEKKIFPIVSLLELMTLDGAISDPRGMIRMINVTLHITLLHTKHLPNGK